LILNNNKRGKKMDVVTEAARPSSSPPLDLPALESSVAGFTCKLQVKYATEELATVVMTALGVDEELQPDKVRREMKVEGQLLCITLTGVEARFLRASFNAFMDVMVLVTRTIEEFGPPKATS
jgi:EKC/KEOPS complex subunit PCC1/LAGE3